MVHLPGGLLIPRVGLSIYRLEKGTEAIFEIEVT
jgi:hypothetical protein